MKVGELLATLGLDTKDFDRGVTQSEGKFRGMGTSIVGMATMAAGALGVIGIGALAKATVSAGMDFEATLIQMAAVAQVPQNELKKLGDLALKMGADTSFSAQQAADAMLELAKGGMSAAQIEAGGLEQTLVLAAAGGLELANAATYMSNTLNAFGMDATQAKEVAAALAGGANASSASVESLGMALSQVGPGAVNAGLSLQETVAVLAAFDQAGIKGSDAGTSLKTMLARLVPTTDEAAAAMKALNLDFTNADGSFKSIGEVAQILQDKLGGLSAEQKTLALSTIFGSDATRAASVLMKEGADGVAKYTAATSDLEAAQRVATATTSGTAGAVDAMMGSFETLATTLGMKLNPFLKDAAISVTGFVNGITDSVPGLLSFAGAIAENVLGALDAMMPVLEPIGMFLAVVLIPHFAALAVSATVSAAQTVAAWVLTKVHAAAAAVAHSIAVVKMIAGWVAQSAAAAKSVAQTVILWAMYKAEAVKSAALWVAQVARKVAAWVLLSAQSAVHAARIVASWIATGAAAIAQGVVHAAQIAVMVAKWVFLGAQSLLAAAKVAAAWLIAMGPIGLVIAAVVGLVALVIANWDTIVRVTKDLWEKVKQFTAQAWSALKSAVSQGVQAVMGFVKGLPGKILGVYANMGGLLVDAGKALIRGFLNGIKSMVGAVQDTLGGITKKLTSWKGPESLDKVILRPAGQMVMQGFIDGIQDKEASVKAKLNAVTTGVVNTATTTLGIQGGVSKVAAAEIGAPIAAGIGLGISGESVVLVGTMSDTLKKLIKESPAVADVANKARALGVTISDEVATGIKNGEVSVDSAMSMVMEAAGVRAAEKAKKIAEDVATNIKTGFDAIMGGMSSIDSMTDAREGLKEARQNVRKAQIAIRQAKEAEREKKNEISAARKGRGKDKEETVAKLEAELADLRKASKDAVKNLEKAESALIDTQLRGISVARDYEESQKKLKEMAGAGMEAFLKYAEAAGLTDKEIRYLVEGNEVLEGLMPKVEETLVSTGKAVDGLTSQYVRLGEAMASLPISPARPLGRMSIPTIGEPRRGGDGSNTMAEAIRLAMKEKTAQTNVRVFVGDREIKDIVRTEVGESNKKQGSSIRTAKRKGVRRG